MIPAQPCLPVGLTTISIILSSPSWRFPGMTLCAIASGFPLSAATLIACQRKPNGNTPHAAGLKDGCFPGAMNRRSYGLNTPAAGVQGPSLSVEAWPTVSACVKCVRTYTSGAAIGSTPLGIGSRQLAIRAAPNPEHAKLRAVVPGVTTLRFRAVPPAPAFHPNSDTPITASVWPAIVDKCRSGQRHRRLSKVE